MDSITIVKSVDVWVDFLLRDTNGVPLSGVSLGSINLWYAKHNATSLVSKSLTPAMNLKEVGNGFYRVQFLASEVDTVGLFLVVVEATGAAQTLGLVHVIPADEAEAGVPVNADSWLPYRAITGYAATGVTGLTNVTSVHYKKFGDANETAKSITPVTDFRELGRGVYSIRFTSTELNTEGEFVYTVVTTGHDKFSQILNIALLGNNTFTFTVELNGVAAAGYYIDVRRQSDFSLVATVQTGADGKAAASLALGDYYATLRNASIVFDTNNVAFSVSSQSSLNTKTLDAAGITASSPAASANTSLGSATLQSPAQVPVKGRVIRVIMKKPQLSGEILYVDQDDLVTDENGKVSKSFTRGLLVTVVVEGTDIVRTFTVPDTDFNLISSALSVADPFTVITPTFPVAPTHV